MRPLADRHLDRIAVGAGFLLAILVYNAVPGWTVPAMGQPLWVTTFAQSIANQHLLALTSNNTGLPLPAAMSFGLPGALLLAPLLWIGLTPPVAYALACCVWLAVAFAGAMRLTRRFGVSARRAALLATVWLCLPMIWAHASYSMLSIGLALLPAYLVPVFDATRAYGSAPRRTKATLFARLAAAGIVSAFMDGYSFVMYAAVSMVILLAAANESRRNRVPIPWSGIWLQVCALVLAGLCYRLYIGHSHYWVAPLSAFRGWGADIAFMVRPSIGESWVADALHLGASRDVDTFFGDRSVWETTFVLPLLLAAMLCLPLVDGWRGWRLAAVTVLIIGTYLSLGPSLKAWSTRENPGVMADGDSHFMPPEAARAPTGSAWLATHLPVVNNMRASYRWLALGMLGMWLLLALAQRPGRHQRKALVAAWCVLIFSVPPPGSHLRDGHAFLAMWHRVDHDVLKPFRASVPPGSVVVALPRDNDFLLGYLAARAHVRTYNTGGDKNIAAAEPYWPSVMRDLPPGQMPADVAATATHLFASGAATVLMVPFYQEPTASHAWPCADVSRAAIPDEDDEFDGACPMTLAEEAEGRLAAVSNTPGMKLVRHPAFALVLPDADLRSPIARDAWSAALYSERPTLPLVPRDLTAGAVPHILIDGWYPIEGDFVWSSGIAALRLPLPADCLRLSCSIRLDLHTFGASLRSPKRITVSSGDSDVTVTARSDGMRNINLTLPPGHPLATLRIAVRQARSPAEVMGSTDNRPLGVALFRVDVTPVGVPAQ